MRSYMTAAIGAVTITPPKPPRVIACPAPMAQTQVAPHVPRVRIRVLTTALQPRVVHVRTGLIRVRAQPVVRLVRRWKADTPS